MSLVQEQLPLRIATPRVWVETVLADFDAFLKDHAACERKAAALAMSFVSRFIDYPLAVEPMISLAREELAHFHEVYRLLGKRGLALGPDEPDPYVKAMLAHVRHRRDEHFLDRLLISGIVEARGCERFEILGEALRERDPELARWYARLGREEAGHYKIFLRIARQYFPEAAVTSRQEVFLDLEAQAMLAAPVRAAVH